MTGATDDDPDSTEATTASSETVARESRDDKPVLPAISRDEQDVGWGDEPRERDADWYRRERPPHHE